MMIGLAIDTSTFVMGVAVANEQAVIGELITNEKKNHSVRLMPAIESLLTTLDVKPTELDRIVVARGPGSYTGVRIGVTVAKSLAWSLQLPLVGISSLEVLAQNGRYFNGYISPLFDARRGQIYTSLYKSESGVLRLVEEERLTMAETWAKKLQAYGQPVLFLGNDVAKHELTFVKALQADAIIGKITKQNPRAGELAQLGLQRAPVSNLHTFVPQYLRMAEAEANWLARQKSGDQQ